MQSDSTVGLRITVWRPYRPSRPLAIENADTATMRFVGPEDELQEEAFTWVTREDVWGGITDDTVRETLREHFVSEFEPTLAPHERGFDKVARILTEIANSMTNTSWSSSTEQLDEDDVSPFRLNALLAFHTQLQWMFQVFKDIPGASLSVR